jgi:hypothetical protein
MSPPLCDGIRDAIALGGQWLHQHQALALFLLVVGPLAAGYWRYSIRPYLDAARAAADRELQAEPVVLPPAEAFPASRLLELPEPTRFGKWLMPELLRLDLTQSQLASRLGVPVAHIHALLYGPPAGASPPRLGLVDAICDSLELDRRAGHAALAGDSQSACRQPSADQP